MILIEQVGRYSEVMSKRQETIVLEMKKVTYIKQNEHLLEETSSESSGSGEEGE